MQHPHRIFKRLSLGVVALLMGLLSIGPFLHSHVGAHVVSGFHMDGVHSLTHTSTANPNMALPSLSVNDDESPALGVASSLPQCDQNSMLVGDITSLLAAFLLVSLLCPPLRVYRACPSSVFGGTYQVGWPPPALAPPHLNP